MRHGIITNFLVILLGLASALMTSCGNYEYVAGELRILPKKPDYHLKGKLQPGAASEILDFQAVYVFEHEFEDSGTKYWYYRFWDDGHVVHRSQSLPHSPTATSAESLWGCDVGYYTLDGNKLRIETFSCCLSTWGRGFYAITEAEIIDGNVVEKGSCERRLSPCPFGKGAGGGTGFGFDPVYRKVPMENLTRQPNW